LSRLASPFATLGLFAGCGSPVINPVTGEAERSVMDERAMIASGKEGQDRVLVEYGVIEDARLRVYLNQVGQGLAAQSHRAHLKSPSLCSTARGSTRSRCPAAVSVSPAAGWTAWRARPTWPV